jgi:hypothetical protein
VVGGVVGERKVGLVRPGMENGRLPGTLDHAEVVLRLERRSGGV